MTLRSSSAGNPSRYLSGEQWEQRDAPRRQRAYNFGTSNVSGNLNVTTSGAITDSGNLAVTGATTLSAGAGNDITLNNAHNFSTVSITSGRNVTLNDTNALVLGASTVSGTLGVTTAGAITQSGALNVTGTTSLAAGAANNASITHRTISVALE